MSCQCRCIWRNRQAEWNGRSFPYIPQLVPQRLLCPPSRDHWGLLQQSTCSTLASHMCGGVWGQRWEATANSAGKNGVNICSIGAQYFSDVPLCKCTQVLNSQASDDNVYHANSICLPCDWIKMCCQCARNSAGQGILTDSGMLICRSTRNRQCGLK